MILSRRQLHFYAALALACALPVVFGAGLIFRPANPVADESLDSLFAAANFAPSSAPDTTVASETLTVSGIKVQAEIGQRSGGDSFLFLQPEQPLRFADALVYWLPEDTAPEGVPDDAVLLGQLSGNSRRQFPIPSAIQGPGQLLFYSRGQNQAIATVPVPEGFFP